MNREIKFRAWDKSDNKMIYDVFPATNGDMAGEYNGRFTLRLPKERIILEQFTGLKDKNGKDIYEGDKISDDTYVYFANGCFKTTYEGDHQGGNLLSEMRCKYIEVIGNIHEEK